MDFESIVCVNTLIRYLNDQIIMTGQFFCLYGKISA